ncbi:MAG: hypothetical protein AAF628_11760 [Planctomycetota bacterium]
MLAMSSALLVTLLLAAPQGADTAPAASVRGITISTHGSGRDWGQDVIVPTIASIRDVGATWIATHPYAQIGADGSVRFRGFKDATPPRHLTRPIEEAHRQGLKIMIKPHLAYWGSPFSWRGEIDFADRAERKRFWTEYRRWIVTLARACRDADAFVVGTEVDRLLGDVAEWRALIRDVRAETKAPLTYAANWTDYRRVGFWDALDAIGIQAYFPLTEKPAPTVEDLRAAWQQQMAELRDYSAEVGRPVVFSELGYNRSHRAAATPWESHTDGEDAEPLQLDCMRVALEAVEAESTVVGAFLWKWFPTSRRRHGNFLVDTPRMRAVVRSAWH